ncbi:peptidoglycan DD-metalloendopeptidase family protein [Blautia massiliensis]|uniref:Peptidoglycan DD-metalloendopeptidase family protein n=1 Tax=Blautia massiliensis (ex Durand et al. 2017) TaxID=1737424 RepID=A0AAW5CFF4_9FIRM|nr:peptidoglycan DD-metalloendopeptidase family protein [Blautia massiliensis (ex Durand et al. 2017)]MCG5033272.1 peptidoglycan DD-metalloendopeptidase family protein [Blautia massiliensis (ex Durand et al. 2017)]
MDISRDKEFRRPKDDAARQPARKTETDVRAGEVRSQDFDLRRACDAPGQEDNRHKGRNLYQGASEAGTVPAADSGVDYPAPQPVSGDSVQDSRGDLQQNGSDFSGRDSFRESRQQDSGRFRRQDADFSRHGSQELSGSGSLETSTASEAGSTNAGETSGRRRMHQHGNKYQQRFQEAAKAEEPQEKQPGAAEGEPKRPSKLEFTADELPPEAADKKLTQARRRAERVEKKLEDAEARLPSRKKLRMETASDPETGKAKKRLKFEQEVKSQRTHVKGSLPMRPVKAAANTAVGYAHKKIYQAEEENVGVKAAHRTELVGEAGARTLYHRHKTAPYRRVTKLQQKSARANAQFAYRQTLSDHPELKKNLLARMWQKQKLKRQYAKAAREAQKTGKRAKDAAVTTEKIAASVVNTVKRHPVICGILVLLLLVVFLISSLFSSFSNIGTGGLGSIAASTYLAEDQDINNAELIYTEWETDLQMKIDRVETDLPGYDEYRYNIGAIEHDPYILMGYLTSAYQNFTYEQIEGVLRQLFNEQYSLTFTEETEIRYRTETHVDPDTGEETEEEVPYEWHILNVKLTATPLSNLVVQRMSAEQKEICEILLQTKGNRQYVKNVFGTNWLPYVTSYYGYRVHPISGEKNYHTGVDIGMAQGTEILAGHDGTVTLAGNAGGYGLCVAIEGEAYKGHTLTTKYGHCSQILVSVGQEVKAGDVIAKVGSTGNSTGPHLHLEVLVDGQYLNPLYFADTGDTSSTGLPNIGAGGGGSYFDYDIPPEALADEQFAAMIAEAEKYLGYPYVWGGASPSTSFDCSGFVSWVVNHTGWNFGRLTADGLLGVCTPVSSADARPGDLIFFQGTYNTSGASHVGIYVGNGMMIHCGDPISYANINTSYWQSHFYTFGRLP